MAMQIVNLTRAGLLDYTAAQIVHFFPDGRVNVRSRLEAHLDEALNRLKKCIDAVRMWTENEFNYLHSTQYCIYLYFLSNTIWRNTSDAEICTKLFLLNKALNGIDCFYEVDMPDIFFIGHSVGIVLAKATYSDHLVLYQNSTVGKNHGIAPVIEQGVVMYPNTAIIGRSIVRANTVIAQGVGLINCETPGNVMAFRGKDNELIFRPLKRDIIADFFRL
jgi:serine O-acetyltransferase